MRVNKKVIINIILLIFIILTLSIKGDIKDSKVAKLINSDPELTKEQLLSEDYLPRYDSQVFYQTVFNPFQTQKIIKANKGYYMFNWLINYVDQESLDSIVLCNKVNCEHEANFGSTCDAAFNCANDIWYYNENIYIADLSIASGSNGIGLYKISLDGSTREKLSTIATGTSQIIVSGTCHRGYLYYQLLQNTIDKSTMNMITRDSFYRVKLEAGAKPELLIDGNEDWYIIRDIKGYGPYVYFLSGYAAGGYGMEALSLNDAKLMRYQIVTGTIETVFETQDRIGSYVKKDNKIYYSVFYKGIKEFDLNTKTDDWFVEQTLKDGFIGNDSNYIYLVDQNVRDGVIEDYYLVYNYNGELVDTINTFDRSFESLFGDDKYLFHQDDYGSIYALDKTQIGTGTHNWVKLDVK